ncbi:MAG TPA: hypothetical protein VHC49_06350 [Mycobacteriales bacterium]|nr:hypothetical protein [Mycobacteriales bacterium]
MLEVAGLRWMHVPTMPVVAALKETSEVWAGGDRLYLLGPFGRRGSVARWRPGDQALSVRPVSLPDSPYGVITR